jgi:hypothetical protein
VPLVIDIVFALFGAKLFINKQNKRGKEGFHLPGSKLPYQDLITLSGILDIVHV